MNRDNSTLRWLAWAVALPLFGTTAYFALFAERFGFVSQCQSLMQLSAEGLANAGLHWAVPLAILGACFYAGAFIALVRFHRLATCGYLLFGGLVAQSYAVAVRPSDSYPKRVELRFGGGQQHAGVEVECNGVSLGKMPFTLTESEFTQRVPVWNTPPEQPVVDLQVNSKGEPWNDILWWRLTWTPHSPFDSMRSRFDGGLAAQHIHDGEGVLKKMREAKYWWRFRKPNVNSLRYPRAFTGGGGGGAVLKYDIHPGIQYPAESKVASLLLATIKDQNYEPTAEWKQVVQRYHDWVLDDLASRARTDQKLSELFDQLVDEHFGRTENETIDETKAAFDRALDVHSNSDDREYDLFADRVLTRIAVEHPHIVSDSLGSIGVHRDEWKRAFGEFGVARQRDLLRLNTLNPSPELFDMMVYLFASTGSTSSLGQQHALKAIAASGRPEAMDILRRNLHDAWENSNSRMPFYHNSKQEESIAAVAHCPDQSLDSQVWYYFSQITPSVFNGNTPIGEFVRDRAKRTQDIPELVRNIASCPGFDDKQKCEFLLEIHDPSVAKPFEEIFARLGSIERTQLINDSSKNRNPAFASALAKYLSPKLSGTEWVTTFEVNLLWNLDAAPAEALLRKYVSSDKTPLNKIQQLSNISSHDFEPGCLSHHAWLVPAIKQMDADRQEVMLKFLPLVGGEEAMAILESVASDKKHPRGWRARSLIADANEKNSRVADPKVQERAKRLKDLASGSIGPDDLLEKRFHSAKWDGEKYVPVLHKDVPK